MDLDKIKRRQSLKVIISEAIMVLAVILMVAILALIVSGYWLNSDFQIERQGLLQISSAPTGASVEIDGSSSWLQKTNTSKVLSSGEHTIVLSKEGYDTWQKKINIAEGLLYRVNYPRLFPEERSAETLLDVSRGEFVTISPSRETLIFTDNHYEWFLINLNNNVIEPKPIDAALLFPGVSLSTVKILDANWDQDESHILLKTEINGDVEWVLMDIRNLANSLNLTQEFSVDFDDVRILDNSSNNLIAIQSGDLRRIDVSGKSISAILIENVSDFDHLGSEIVFSAKQQNGEDYYVGTTKIGDDKVTKLLESETPAKIALSEFYDEKYITVLLEKAVTLYKDNNFEKLISYDVSSNYEDIKVGHNGEYIIFYTRNNIAAIDMEASALTEWQTEGPSFGWIDNYMIYTIADNNLIVYDFDGLNRRQIATNIPGQSIITITDDKWLYFLTDDSLIREWLIPR